MSRVVVVLDVGYGQEALTFSTQSAAQEWLDKHPAVDDCTQGLVPITTRRDVIRLCSQLTTGRGISDAAPDA